MGDYFGSQNLPVKPPTEETHDETLLMKDPRVSTSEVKVTPCVGPGSPHDSDVHVHLG